MNAFDARLTPARPDLAAAHLRGKVEAARFVEGRRMQVRDAALAMRREPRPDAPLDTEALLGEIVTVYDEEEGFAWAQLERDGYVGHVAADGLGPVGPAPTHRVSALRTFVYPGPSIKVPPLLTLTTGARLAVSGAREAFAVTPQGYVFADHLAPLDAPAPDFVAVAEMFLHAPYLWGGKTGIGLDCSALIQTALHAAGMDAPRDSDMIEAAVGERLAFDGSLSGLRRGDLVFWKGHCGIMRDAHVLLHANGHHMAVASEPLLGARDRILAKSHGPVTSVKRIA